MAAKLATRMAGMIANFMALVRRPAVGSVRVCQLERNDAIPQKSGQRKLIVGRKVES